MTFPPTGKMPVVPVAAPPTGKMPVGPVAVRSPTGKMPVGPVDSSDGRIDNEVERRMNNLSPNETVDSLYDKIKACSARRGAKAPSRP